MKIFKSPETLNELLMRIGTILLVSMILLGAVRIIDGDSHRLGTIKVKYK